MGGTATAGGVTVAWAAATDVGKQRSVNEDAFLAAPPVFVVADGMGGHHAGDVASRLVVEQFATFGGAGLRSVQDVVGLLDDVNRSILDSGRRSRAMSGMGTTAVGLMLVDNGDRSSWLLFNIGDSRAYRFGDAGLEQLSVDHSYVQELVDAGEITAASARTHPHRNVVTRALGVEEGPKPDLWLRSPLAGERFMLCSDGLSSEVDDEGIADVLATGTAEVAAAALVGHALAAGGHDNVTVMVLDVVEVDDELAAVDTSPRELALAELTTRRAEQVRRARRTTRADDPTLEQPVVRAGDSVAPASEHRPAVTGPVVAGLIDRVPPQSELVEGASDADDVDGCTGHTGEAEGSADVERADGECVDVERAGVEPDDTGPRDRNVPRPPTRGRRVTGPDEAGPGADAAGPVVRRARKGRSTGEAQDEGDAMENRPGGTDPSDEEANGS